MAAMTRRCSRCQGPGHNRRTCPRGPAAAAADPPDRFAEYSRASDAAKALKAQLVALGEADLAEKTQQLLFDIGGAYWRDRNQRRSTGERSRLRRKLHPPVPAADAAGAVSSAAAPRRRMPGALRDGPPTSMSEEDEHQLEAAAEAFETIYPLLPDDGAGAIGVVMGLLLELLRQAPAAERAAYVQLVRDDLDTLTN